MAEHYIINGMIYVEGQFRTGILGIHDGKIALYDANYQIQKMQKFLMLIIRKLFQASLIFIPMGQLELM